MPKNITILCLFSIFFLSMQVFAQPSITFTFANGQITGTSPKYYEFDVMAQAGEDGTYLGDTQVYINYNTQGFGNNIAGNSKIVATKGTLLSGDLIPGLSLYDIVNIVDNSSSNVAIAGGYNYDGSPESANLVPTSPTQLLHISIEIADYTQNAGLSFDEDLMTGVQYHSDNSTKYEPVIATDSDDSPLPVELSSFIAKYLQNHIILEWSTASEINNQGFEIFKKSDKSNDYSLLDSYTQNTDLEGQGNSSSGMDYQYTDTDIQIGETYWYKLVDVDLAGIRTEHGPVSVQVSGDMFAADELMIPGQFELYQNYPNPFNPSTKIVFDIPENGSDFTYLNLSIYDIQGKLITSLTEGQFFAGRYRLEWNGSTRNAEPVPSGIYFAVLTTENFSKAIKMTLIR